MKKFFACLMLFAWVVPAVYAAELEPVGTPLRKLQRGFLNIALSPIELLYNIKKENKVESFPPGWFLGIGKGSMAMVGRAVVGAAEIVSFPVASPAGYQPILNPEFPWQLLDGLDPTKSVFPKTT